MVRQRIFTMLLVLMASVITGVNAQDMCTSPPVAPANEQSIVTSTPERFFLYPEPFDSSCVGRVVNFEYCYVLVRTSGTREDVFTLVILEDMGDSYSVATMETIREDRSSGDCELEDTNNGVNRCCQTGLLSLPVDVTTSHAYGFVTQGVENQLLVLNSSDPIAGYELDSRMFTTGENISETDLGIYSISPSPIPLRSLRFIIQNEPAEDLVMPLSPTISTTSGAVNTPGPSSTPVSSNTLHPTGSSGDDSSIGSTILYFAVGTAGVLVATLSVIVLAAVIVMCVKRKQNTTSFEMTGNEAYATAGDLELSGDVITSQNQAYDIAATNQPSDIII